MNAKILMLLAFMSPLVLGVETVEAEIDKLQFNAKKGWFYVHRHSGWGVCNNTQYAYYDGTPEEKALFVSLALSAFMYNKRVILSGSCTNDNENLDAHYIRVFK